MIIFLFLNKLISASVVALPRVITRSDFESTLHSVCASSQSYTVACGKSVKSSRESLLRIPSMIIHSTSRCLHVDAIVLNMLRDH